MPYANNTAFARQMRAYIADKRRRLPKVTVDQYERWLKQFGKMLDWKPPKEITVRDLETVESKMMSRFSESTIAVRMPVLRDMLTDAGNKQVQRYRKLCTLQPAKDSVFLTEEQIGYCRLMARSLSNTHELVFSLMMDNGLRPIDVYRLTMNNTRELLDTGESMILGKGRNGGKYGKLVLSPITVPPLKWYLLLRRNMKGSELQDRLMLSCVRTARPMSTAELYKMIKSVFEKAGIDASPRDLRKSCGNRVYKLTRDVAMSAMILRHSSPSTSFRHYIGADSVEMRDVQARLAAKYPDESSQLV